MLHEIESWPRCLLLRYHYVEHLFPIYKLSPDANDIGVHAQVKVSEVSSLLVDICIQEPQTRSLSTCEQGEGIEATPMYYFNTNVHTLLFAMHACT